MNKKQKAQLSNESQSHTKNGVELWYYEEPQGLIVYCRAKRADGPGRYCGTSA